MTISSLAKAIDNRFLKTIYLVEATNCERLNLWAENSDESPWVDIHSSIEKIKWKQDGAFSYVIKYVGKRPINICFSFDTLDEKRVCFWEPISELVDYKIIQKWLDKNLKGIPRTNAMNFGQVTLALK